MVKGKMLNNFQNMRSTVFVFVFQTLGNEHTCYLIDAIFIINYISRNDGQSSLKFKIFIHFHYVNFFCLQDLTKPSYLKIPTFISKSQPAVTNVSMSISFFPNNICKEIVKTQSILKIFTDI